MNVISQTTVFAHWLAGLADVQGKGVILARIEAAKLGNFGDCEPIGDGLSEMRVHSGPGYRVYFMREGYVLYLLLCGGDKSTQKADIRKARSMARQVRDTAKAAMKPEQVENAKVESAGRRKLPAKGKGKSPGRSRKG